MEQVREACSRICFSSTEEVSEAEFDVAHPEYTLDGAVAQFAGQGQDIRIQR
jgi:hypothetical protein